MGNNVLSEYKNGNVNVKIYTNGTREVEYEEELALDYPLNIDIRISEKCAFGYNPNTNKAICDFCHESATTDGKDADLNILFEKLSILPKGIELAIGMNQLHGQFIDFLYKCKQHGFIVNITVNQGHIHRDKEHILKLIKEDLIKGLGISYRPNMKDIPIDILEYSNTVIHVIAGIDNFDNIKELNKKGVNKILVLGEKDFGFNLNKVNIKSYSHIEWLRKVHQLFKLFKVVSFDNLGIEQLKIKRFIHDWDTFYQGEHSFYINAVEGYYSPSSRSDKRTSYNDISLLDYFKSNINKIYN